MGKVIGIDLGTTNSCVAFMDGDEAAVIPNAEEGRTTSSVVGFSKSGERLVGEAAKRQAITNPDKTVMSVKRHMGSDHKETIDGKSFTPQDISAMILQKLKADAEATWRISERQSLLFQLTLTIASAKRQKMRDGSPVWKYFALSTNRLRLLWHMEWIRKMIRRSSSLTWVVEPLMFPSWRWAMASLK